MSEIGCVTVIIPTFRRAGLLPRAIQSVLTQTYEKLEIVVVDDCSPDDTERVVRAIGDSRVRYLRHERNKGLPAARNTGIRAAQGEYIAFLDDDDEWRKDKIEKQLAVIDDFAAVACTAVVHGGFALRVHKGKRITVQDLRRGSFAPSSLIARADVLREAMFDEQIRQGEDWDAFIRIAQRYSIGWVSEPLLLYDEGGHPRMTNEAKALTDAELEKRTAVLYKHREFFGEKWFRYHLADALLGYIGSRPNKLVCLQYAVRRSGIGAVTASLITRVRRKCRRLTWEILTSRWNHRAAKGAAGHQNESREWTASG